MPEIVQRRSVNGGAPATPANTDRVGTLLQEALLLVPGSQRWGVVLGMALRSGRVADAVLLTGGAVVVLTIRPGAAGFLPADRRAAEDAALDLADFHTGCRNRPVVPILLVPNGARPTAPVGLLLPGATPPVDATRLLLPIVLAQIAHRCPHGPAADLAAWMQAPYRPVDGLMAAACDLYARHGVATLRLARTGRGGLARTAAALTRATAPPPGRHVLVFVTGDPGAGKTLCGLNLAFVPNRPAAFLTGNPALVHVLREALARDAAARGMDRNAARRRMQHVIQALPAFRDFHAAQDRVPTEAVLVIDEAQRCWTASHAAAKTRTRPQPLHQSEPALLLDIMARRQDGAVLVCLLGGGQEIHAGEGGLAEWGVALAARPGWHAIAPGTARRANDPRQRLPNTAAISWDDDLHLADAVRAVHAPSAAAWVDAVLAGDCAAAARLATPGAFRLTRSLDRMRQALQPRGSRRCGLLASSGARRLRAEGLGSVLDHLDPDAVARWFLDPWPDIRSSDALETAATEFGVQGLELDHAGLCWDLDLVPTGAGWQARQFRATAWTTPRHPATQANRLNAYRVLLTRARHGTVIWVPRGSPRDPTRNPALYDAVAARLRACGADDLDGESWPAQDAPLPEPALL